VSDLYVVIIITLLEDFNNSQLKVC